VGGLFSGGASLIQTEAAGARRAGIPTGFCPTIAGMPLLARHWSALGLTAGLVCAASPARAAGSEGVQVALEYRIDPTLTDCPSESDLSAAIVKQLGYDAFAGSSPTPHRVRAAISRTANGTEAQVDWLDSHGESEGERRLASDSTECGEVARALTFAIAVQIQLHAAAEAAPSSPAPQPQSQPRPQPPRLTPPPAERGTKAMVGAGVLVAHGLIPATSLGLRVFGSIWTRRLSVEVSTGLTLPTTLTLPDRSGFSASSLTGSVAPCVRVSFVGLCAVGALGQLSVRGQGVDQIRSPSSLMAAGGGRIEVLWPALSALGVLIHLEALALATPRTVLLNQQPVWSTAPVVLGAGIDLGALFR
jgi:hypothetical protein